MIDSKIPRIVKEKIVGDKVWQIILFSEDGKEKFDVVYFNKSDANEMANEVISSKKTTKAFEDLKEAVKFLEKQK